MSLPYPSNVTAGDILVVAAAAGTTYGGSITSPPTDSWSNAWNVVDATASYTSASDVWYSVARVGGPETVSVRFSLFMRNGLCVYELANAAAPIGSKSSNDLSVTASVNSLNYNKGAFLLGAVGATETSTGVVGTNGFTTDISSPNYYLMEHEIASSAGSSNFTVGFQNVDTNLFDAWADSAAVFNPAH
jgi:hypothetical protein